MANREFICIPAIDLRFIGDFGYVLSLKPILILIRCVREVLVLFGVPKEPKQAVRLVSGNRGMVGWRTHVNAAVEALLAHGHNDVLVITVKDSRARSHGTIDVDVDGVGCGALLPMKSPHVGSTPTPVTQSRVPPMAPRAPRFFCSTIRWSSGMGKRLPRKY